MFRCATVAIMTLFFQFVCTKQYIEANCEWFSCVYGYYGFTFGLQWVWAIGYMEEWYDGYLTKYLCWTLY